MTGPGQASPGSIAQNALSRFLIGPTVVRVYWGLAVLLDEIQADLFLSLFVPQMAVVAAAEPPLKSRAGLTPRIRIDGGEGDRRRRLQ